MTQTIEVLQERGVAVLAIRTPWECALSAPVRAALLEAIDSAEEDDAATALVLHLDGRLSPVGFDLADTSWGAGEPSLRDVCERLDFCEKPILAALDGVVQGAGVELALCADQRLGSEKLRLSMPDVHWGLPPQAGGSQRLPRLIGAQAALEILQGGALLSADVPLLQGLFCAPPSSNPLQDACVLARDGAVRRNRTRDRRDGFADMQAFRAALEAGRAAAPSPGTAQATMVDLVEAAPLLPFEAALNMEATAYQDLERGTLSRALRHLARSERRLKAARPVAAEPLSQVVVLGGSALGVQMVAAALDAPMRVHWGIDDAELLVRARSALEEHLARTHDDTQTRLALLTTGSIGAAMGQGGLVLHAVKGLRETDADGVIHARLHSGRVDGLGLRFGAPLRSTRLVEILRGPKATDAGVDAGFALAQALDRMALPFRSSGASAAERLSNALHRAADGLLDLGLTPDRVDAVLTDWGLPQGPFVQRDVVGLSGFSDAPRGEGARNWAAELEEINRTGRHAGRGFYHWEADGRPKVDRAVTSLLNGARAPAQMPSEQALVLLIGAVANESARILFEERGLVAADIDVVSVHGLHMPRACGGILHAVSQIGLFRVKKALEHCAHPDRAFWDPVPVWQELVKNGRDFSAL